MTISFSRRALLHGVSYVRGPFENFVDWRQCAAAIQREAVTLMPSCSGGDEVIVT
jgi:hypothetical protein